LSLSRSFGIDPGLGRLGFGVVERKGGVLKALDFGCIETPPRIDIPRRLRMLYERLEERIFLHSPDFFCVERLFFGKNITTAEYVWQARGVVLLLAARNDIPVFEPQPSQIKSVVCGYGNAGKSQVQKMVQRLLALDVVPTPDDAADALAAALTGLLLQKTASLFASEGGVP
jgi:crossover junction endodeoxyribonuclease RuvC